MMVTETNIVTDEKNNGEDAFGEFKGAYVSLLSVVELVHRRLLDVVKDEFERKNINEINAVQALMLYNMAGSEITAGELRTRGYYLGTNVSYNLKKLVDLGYVYHQKSKVDRRAVKISLTGKGQEAVDIVAGLYNRQLETLTEVGGVTKEDVEVTLGNLRKIERFWSDQIRYRL